MFRRTSHYVSVATELWEISQNYGQIDRSDLEKYPRNNREAASMPPIGSKIKELYHHPAQKPRNLERTICFVLSC